MTDRINPDFQLGDDMTGKRIVVAMSGGVDSSVVAALAARTGAETIGITLQLYDHGEAVGRTGSCCAGQDIRDARAVAEKLGIDLRVAEKRDLILAEADYLNKSVQPNSVSLPDIVDSCHSVRKSRYEKSQEDNS